MNTKAISNLSLIIFILGFLAIAFALIFPGSAIFIWILGAISVIYLLSGWYLFRGSYPEGKPVVLFFMGYFYSGIFLGFVFTFAKWPFEAINAGSLFWSIVQIVLLIILRKKIPSKGFTKLITEASLLMVISILVTLHHKGML